MVVTFNNLVQHVSSQKQQLFGVDSYRGRVRSVTSDFSAVTYEANIEANEPIEALKAAAMPTMVATEKTPRVSPTTPTMSSQLQ